MTRDIIKIYANDGKEFLGTNYNDLVKERNAYESDLALQKQKAEVERKAREEKEKKLAQYRNTKLQEINEDLSKVADKIKDYEKATGCKIIIEYDCTGKMITEDTLNTLDFAWDNLLDDLVRHIHNLHTKQK
jgi:DNA gyrase/topoisomerase IV subunit A